jgi:hypothetical protein
MKPEKIKQQAITKPTAGVMQVNTDLENKALLRLRNSPKLTSPF